jgi:hypothetical protein
MLKNTQGASVDCPNREDTEHSHLQEERNDSQTSPMILRFGECGGKGGDEDV